MAVILGSPASALRSGRVVRSMATVAVRAVTAIPVVKFSTDRAAPIRVDILPKSRCLRMDRVGEPKASTAKAVRMAIAALSQCPTIRHKTARLTLTGTDIVAAALHTAEPAARVFSEHVRARPLAARLPRLAE